MKFVAECKLSVVVLTGVCLLMRVQHTDGANPCTATSIDECIVQSGIQQLLADGISSKYYCISGPILVKLIYECIHECQFSPNTNTNLENIIEGFNEDCSGKDSECKNIIERYNRFTNCYEDGLDTTINNIVHQYNENYTQLHKACQKLPWGHSCQKRLAGKCSYLKTLLSAEDSSNYLKSAAFHVCGSESGKFVYTDTRYCHNSIPEKVHQQCNITCNISQSTDSTICQLLQSQADCIMETTAGCSPLQSLYIVPRFASYWAANELLNCKINIEGVLVKARVSQNMDCNIGTVLNSCFSLSPSDFQQFTPLDVVKQLLTGQFPLTQICRKLRHGSTKDDLLRTCLEEVRPCDIPLAQVYNWPDFDAPLTTYSSARYTPLLGPFALNAWGLDNIVANLDLGACQVESQAACWNP